MDKKMKAANLTGRRFGRLCGLPGAARFQKNE